jgi:hypothetical protein
VLHVGVGFLARTRDEELALKNPASALARHAAHQLLRLHAGSAVRHARREIDMPLGAREINAVQLDMGALARIN